MNSPLLLKADALHKRYRDTEQEVHVLRGVSLSLHKGEVLAIVGPSGAGKSTLLHILGGLDKPSAGIVELDGRSIYGMPDQELAKVRNRDFGFIFQFYHLLPELTAMENVLLPAVVKQGVKPDKGMEARALELLGKVGLTHRVTHKPHQLSGGEQQRVAIARSLMNTPKIIFCDEPTGNLDSQSGHEVIELLLALNAEFQQTLVLVTHDVKLAERAQRVHTMADGLIVTSS